MMRAMTLMIVALLAACSGSAKQTQTDAQYADAMAKEHAQDDPTASGAEGQKSGTYATSGAMVEYGTVDGKPVSGYLATPTMDAAPTAAVIVIHEWWGLNDNIKTMTDKLASQGYLALAVDMYGAPAATDPEAAKAMMTTAMEKPNNGVINLTAAHAFLSSKGVDKLGVIGWCFGGMWSLEAGLQLGAELDAVVVYYGRVKTTKEELAPLQAPLLGIFAALDQGIPVDQVTAFEAALGEAGKSASIHIYDGVDHAFANPSGQRYSQEAAEDAWAKTLAFFAEHL